STGANDLTLDAGQNLVLADATISLTGGTTVTVQRTSATADILAINNSGAGSLSLNLTDGGLQTGSTSRLTNAGALENIASLTGSGALTIASTGGGNNVTINGAN